MKGRVIEGRGRREEGMVWSEAELSFMEGGWSSVVGVAGWALTSWVALRISLLLIFTLLNNIEWLHILKVILHMIWNISALQILSSALSMLVLKTQFLILLRLATYVLKMSQCFILGHRYNNKHHLSDLHSNAS